MCLGKCQKDSDGDGVSDNFDQCPNTNAGSSVDVNGCVVFYLPQDSISVRVNSNTCIGSNDGSIIIKANNTNYDYSVNIENEVYSLSYFDGYEKTHRNLGIGTYRLCINVVGYENFEQCYDVSVSSPDPIAVTDLFNPQTGNLSLNLGGSAEYQIVHNGNTNYINTSSYSLQLHKGLNTVQVKTDLDCQGTFEMNYFYSNEVKVYPNPVNNNLKFVIGGTDDSVEVVIFDIRGKVVMKKSASTLHLNRSYIDVSNLEAGIYFVEISSETINKNIKIVKNEK